ncbi:hypothetical protein RvY_09060 [Ramazzottius varieornatus]|uniref:Prospero domain-containing protein n=1 Tax=Ramazzottius varieornatus TaxID=947166 RepID=A0A1D1VAB5_RAMVA|nr:hypothetical protein RvY_09060 [Ramazzottius varieornatus]
MDSPAYFPASLPNQTSVVSPFAKSFPDYPRGSIYPYEMRMDPPLSNDEDNDEKNAFPLFNGNVNIRYQSAIRKGGVAPAKEFFGGESVNNSNSNNNNEPADLSTKAVTGDSQPQQPANTRLLREILQGKKSDDASNSDETEGLDKDGHTSVSPSIFDDESDSASRNDVAENYQDEESATGKIPTVQNDKRSRVESIVSTIRVPSNGTSSENSEPSSCSQKVSKRKQVFPKQVDGSQRPLPNEGELLRRQLSMMQEQIDVMKERLTNGQKRKLDEVDQEPAVAVLNEVTHRNIPANTLRLAALISTEIHEKISPIVTSVVSKYLHAASNAEQSAQSMQSHNNNNEQRSLARSQAPTPNGPEATPPPPMERAKEVPSRNAEKDGEKLARQQVNQSADPPRKAFGNMFMNFPGSPFYGNENKLTNELFTMPPQFMAAAMAGAPPPTMYPGGPHFQHFFRPGFPAGEQTEALPLLVQQKRKRHKVTDTRVTPRVVSKSAGGKEEPQERKYSTPSHSPMNGLMNFGGVANSFLARSYESLQGLNHSDFSPFHASVAEHARMGFTSPFYNRGTVDRRETASMYGGSAGSPADQENDQNSMDGSDVESASDTMTGGQRPGMQFTRSDSLNFSSSSTLTPMHLRKAKLMFFYTRYPNSTTLKTFFPDVKFNKNNTAQLVKWFSNFREFYYIQMEKFAKQALADGIQSADDIQVSKDSELYRTLNLHYNRNNHIDVPDSFPDVVEQTLKEFFKALQAHKDLEPSWKKSIYKIINRMDDVIPDFFKSPHFLQELE